MKRKKWHEHGVLVLSSTTRSRGKKHRKVLASNCRDGTIACKVVASTVDRSMWPNNVRSTYTPVLLPISSWVWPAGHTPNDLLTDFNASFLFRPNWLENHLLSISQMATYPMQTSHLVETTIKATRSSSKG